MKGIKKEIFVISISSIVLLALVVADVSIGTSNVSVREVINSVMGREVPLQTRTIVVEIRLVRVAAAFLAGVAVSVCGLIMQTFFRNPLAGPFVLGINSGASLGAAIFVIGFPVFASADGLSLEIGVAGAAWIGAGSVLLLVSLASHRLKNILAVLVLGMMFSSGIDAIVQVLQYFGNSTEIKSYVLWTMGSLGSVSSGQLPLLAGSVIFGIIIVVLAIKPLNLLLLGEEYAVSMGVNIKRTRYALYLATVLLAGTVTAFCGPIGFIGLASPHIARFVTGRSDHKILIPASAFTGAAAILICDMTSRLLVLPLNVMTSLLGIPVVLWIVLKHTAF